MHTIAGTSYFILKKKAIVFIVAYMHYMVCLPQFPTTINSLTQYPPILACYSRFGFLLLVEHAKNTSTYGRCTDFSHCLGHLYIPFL